MGFATIGHPSGELSEEDIRQFLSIYLSSWFSELNYENYANDIFNLDLKIFIKSKINLIGNENRNSLVDNQRNINKYIIWELQSITSLIGWIESVFDFYEFDKRRISSFKNMFEIEDKNIEIHYSNKKSNEIRDFITFFKNNNSVSNWRRQDWIQEKINESSKDEILYFCIIMYLDFLKIEEFLNSKYNYDLPEVQEKPTNTFLDFIQNVRNKEDFANDLKNTFNIEVGNNLKIMYQQLEMAKIIVLLDSQMSAFHTAMESYFDRDIKTFEAFRKGKDFNDVAIGKINLKLKPLIDRHKINL